ncbi:nicotinamide riboside transporter PnuC [Francisella tularensis]|uniref:nicotinamide riboside transporter PnuC n=1 Tax=Francisella tularensis TaxID=263 RepID=UPI0004AC891E
MNVLKSTFTGWSKKEVVWLCSCILLTILAAKGKVFKYVLGLIGALMYAVISYQNHVFGQLLLAIFFLCPIQFYGWYNWTRPHNNTIEQQIKIKNLLKYSL